MKYLRLLSLLILPIFVFAQKSDKSKPDPEPMKKLVLSYLLENKLEWKLTDKDINSWTISDFYSNEKTSTTYLYIHQQVNGIRIFNAVSSVSIKDGKIKSFAKRLYPDAESQINTDEPSNSPISAIQKTADHLGLKMNDVPKLVLTNNAAHRTYYSSPGISKNKIRVELVFQPFQNTQFFY